MRKKMLRGIGGSFRGARLEKRLTAWGQARRRELDRVERSWSDEDVERITAALPDVPGCRGASAPEPSEDVECISAVFGDVPSRDGLTAAPKVEHFSDAQIEREFESVTGPVRQVVEVEAHMDAGLDFALEAHRYAYSDPRLIEQAYGRKVVEKTAALKEVPAFDGIGDFLLERFPRLVELGAQKAVPYPTIVAMIFAGGCLTGWLAFSGELRWALVALLFTTVIDCLDGILIRTTGRDVGAGKLISCLVSHAADLIMFLGLAAYASSAGQSTVALIVSSSATLSIFGSFTRMAALRVGVRIDRSIIERMPRFGGLFLAFAFGVPVMAAVLVVAYVPFQLWDVIKRVDDAQVWGMAMAVDGAEGASESRAWAWRDKNASVEPKNSMVAG
ncbi:MAG TPA: hypothetical protein VG318_14020 [Actinomycetota bacterium]|nr:hypothetical protein [Actinomycetota bacterium]